MAANLNRDCTVLYCIVLCVVFFSFLFFSTVSHLKGVRI
jgi:hypothetical protein